MIERRSSVDTGVTKKPTTNHIDGIDLGLENALREDGHDLEVTKGEETMDVILRNTKSAAIHQSVEDEIDIRMIDWSGEDKVEVTLFENNRPLC